jgi:hypothetical protein
MLENVRPGKARLGHLSQGQVMPSYNRLGQVMLG